VCVFVRACVQQSLGAKIRRHAVRL